MNSLLTLYIVEDEKNIRESIAELIDFKSIGISKVILARNGKDALEKMQDTVPDIVLTDVRMPVMTGTEMAETVYREYPDCVILFLSGYADKEYLMTAIRIEAFQYIEKPVSIEELTSHLSSAVAKYVTARDAKLRTENLTRFHDENLQTAKSEVLLNALKGNFEDSSREYPVFSASSLSLLGVCLSPSEDPSPIRKMLPACFGDASVLAFWQERFFFVLTRKDSHRTALDVLSSPAFEGMLSEHHTVLSIPDFSFPARGKNLLPELTDTLLFQYFYNIPFSENNSLPKVPHLDDLVNRLNDFDNELLVDNGANIPAHLEQVRNELLQKKYAPDDVRRLYYAFYEHMQHYLHPGASTIHTGAGYFDFVHAETLGELHNTLTELLFTQQEVYLNKDPRIRSIMNYINENLSDPGLCVASVSEVLKLSPNYISGYFNREVGTSLAQYIAQKRIKKAKLMLTTTDQKMAQIASECGFNDVSYFSSVFKKHTGVTPLAFRKAGVPR